MASEPEAFWGFGYGANMSAKHLEESKKVVIIESARAVLKDHKLAFPLRGPDLVEPAFGGVQRDPGSQVHGLAYKVSKSDMDDIISKENIPAAAWNDGAKVKASETRSFYDSNSVEIETYEGRKLKAIVLITSNPSKAERLPSKRYMKILIDGAGSAGLSAGYIRHLESLPAFETPVHILEARSKFIPRDFAGLREIPLKELESHKNDRDEFWTSILGFVIRMPSERYLQPFRRGVETTSKSLALFRGEVGKKAENGEDFRAIVEGLKEEELEYLRCWLDQWMFQVDDNYNIVNVSTIVGCLKEWKQMQ